MVDFNNTESYSSRTAGRAANAVHSIQSWKNGSKLKSAHQAQNAVIAQLEKASEGRIGTFDVELRTASAYADSGRHISTGAQNKDAYTFGDVIDIVNPLQHLPVIGMAYRKITGDTIHPMSQIIGGAIYGGPVGAITGTMNAVSQVQTGKDISDHALSLAGISKNHTPQSNINFNVPQAEKINALSFAQENAPRIGNSQFKALKIASKAYQNTSGLNAQTDLDNLPPRERMTSLSLSQMPESL